MANRDVIDLTGDSDPDIGDKPYQQLNTRMARRKASRSLKEAGDCAVVADTPKPASRSRARAKSASGEIQEMKEPRAKKKKVIPEKRKDAYGKTVRYAARPSQKVLDRIKRALPGSGHRMFIIDRTTLAPVGSGNPAEEFAILGATGNVYTVTISQHPHCSCPDHANGNICKHILFVMLRAIRLSPDDPLVWQRALMKDEAEALLSGSRGTRTVEYDVVASEAVREQWHRSQAGVPLGAVPEEGGKDGGHGGQRPLEGECPICYDCFKSGSERAADQVVWCKACGNNIHTECFASWKKSKADSGAPVTCVYCRARWSAAEVKAADDDYVNLRQYSAAHAGVDTSLDALYGPSAMWIRNRGGARGGAASIWNAALGLQ